MVVVGVVYVASVVVVFLVVCIVGVADVVSVE